MNKENSATSSKEIASAIKWTSIQFVLDTLFRLSVRLVLAKLLLPDEFGLVGMSTIFIAIAGAASELGMTAALIQKKDDRKVEKMYPTAFWSGILWGLAVFLLMSLVVGPFAASFYGEPMLVKLIPILSLGILLKPLSFIHSVILTRKMDFKSLARASNISGFVAGIVAITCAYLGLGVWSLAINNILSVTVTIPLLFMITKWTPVLQWNRDHFKEIFGFGAYSSATGIFSTLTYNIDNLMIGKYLGAAMLGSYTLSFSLTEQLRQVISNILNKVMYPVFGKAQDDKAKLRDYFLKIININAILIYPLMTFLLIFAREIITGFFGQRWELAIVPLQILSVAMMVHLLVNSFTSLLRGIGKPSLEMKIIMGLTIFILIPSLFFGIKFYGLIGATYAILINKIFLAIAGLVVLKNEIGLSILSVFKTVKNSVISVVFSAFVVVSIRFTFSHTNVIMLGALYFISYILLIYQMEKSNLKPFLKKIL